MSTWDSQTTIVLSNVEEPFLEFRCPTPPPVKDESPEYAALREMAGGKSIFCSTPILEYDVSYRKFGN